jgi:hypothetical protein
MSTPTDYSNPSEVVRVMESLGPAGRAWLAALPVILAQVSGRWNLQVGYPYEGGAVVFVAPAERSDLSRVVLKISILEDETRAEPDALALWNGDGRFDCSSSIAIVGRAATPSLETSSG